MKNKTIEKLGYFPEAIMIHVPEAFFQHQNGEGFGETGNDLEGAHDAMNDVVASLRVLQGMIKEEHIPSDVSGILKFQANGEEFDSMVDFAGKFIRNKDGVILLNFGKHRGQPAEDNLDFLDWMINKDFTKDTKGWCYEIINQGSKNTGGLF